MVIAILIGSFVPFIIISTLIVFHEMGHFLIAKMLGVEVDKIYLYPLGGISKFNIKYNEKFIKELLITISGPLAQHITSILLTFIFPSYSLLINTYHYGILIFNLLPIVPLDGGKLLTLLLSTVFPFKKSIIVSINLAYITFIILLIINLPHIKINSIVLLIFLFIKINKEKEQISNMYEKFILERYLNNYNFKKCVLINNKNDFYKQKRHIIREKGQYFLENEYLQKKYKKSEKNVDNVNPLC